MFEGWKIPILGLAAAFAHSNSLKCCALIVACLVHWCDIVHRIDSSDWWNILGHNGLDLGFAPDLASVHNHCCYRARRSCPGILPEGNDFGLGLVVAYFDHDLQARGPALGHSHCGSGDTGCSVDTLHGMLPDPVHTLAIASARLWGRTDTVAELEQGLAAIVGDVGFLPLSWHERSVKPGRTSRTDAVPPLLLGRLLVSAELQQDK